MDPSTSARLIEKARSYGLHSCSICQEVLIDLTPLALSNKKNDEYESGENVELKSAFIEYDAGSFEEMILSRFEFTQDLYVLDTC
jgi:hypothetical protein